MAKRFIEPDWKELRKLPEHMQRAWFYIWDKCDECGVYTHDEEYMTIDLKVIKAITLQDLAKLPECEIFRGEKIIIKNFISVNYTALKENYNPHKPAFRALQKNGLNLNSSLNEAYLNLEEEDVKEDEDKEEDVKEAFRKSETLLTGTQIIPTICRNWYKTFPTYTKDQQEDFGAVGKIIDFMQRQHGITDILEPDAQDKIVNTMQQIAENIRDDPKQFWANKPLKSIANNIQEQYNNIKNPPKNGSKSKNFRNDLQDALDKRFAGQGQT